MRIASSSKVVRAECQGTKQRQFLEAPHDEICAVRLADNLLPNELSEHSMCATTLLPTLASSLACSAVLKPLITTNSGGARPRHPAWAMFGCWSPGCCPKP